MKNNFNFLLSGLIIGFIWFVFIQPPPQGFDVSLTYSPSSPSSSSSSSIGIPTPGYLNTTIGSFLPLNNYIERKYQSINGGETIFISKSGIIYTGTADGKLLRLSNNNNENNNNNNKDNKEEEIVVITNLPGGILGGAVTFDEKGIYVCVVPVGLVYVDLITKKVEIVSSISDDNLPIRFADDVVIANDGKVYFTDASLIAPWINQHGFYDPMATSSLDLFTGSGTGRVLVYDPKTGLTKTLLNKLRFANGITLSPDNNFLIVCETFGVRLTRIWLAGPKSGIVDYFKTSLPGIPDGISLASDGGYWVALNCKVEPQLVLVSKTPLLGWILARINPTLLPPPKPFGGILKLNSVGIITHIFLDDLGSSTHGLTAVTEYNNGLYLGSLKNSFTGFINLTKVPEFKL